MALNRTVLKVANEPATAVTPFLLLGSYRNAMDKNEMKAAGIRYVINLAHGQCESKFPDTFSYLNIGISDTDDAPINLTFDECFRFIEEARLKGSKCLVQCVIGQSRGPTVAIAYLMKKYNISLRRAFNHIYSKRPIIKPNQGFMRHLQELDSQIMQAKQEKQLARRGLPPRPKAPTMVRNPRFTVKCV
eukprot:GFYU01001760.1.p1 GENE.GFYU01001760.1~~GFYU01001760.1.p1  ORF type:complete len:189 (+),score=43.42 GFYU01001760.1:196-762(+)